MNTYDVAVIGAGATGASVAWQLSHYNLKVALVDRCADASFGVSKANSGIVHGGFHHSADSTLKAKLELEGNPMFDALQKELDFEFNRCGILVVAYSDEELPQLQKLYERGVANNVPGIEMCDRARLLELEPKLTDAAVKGFFVPKGGVIEPYGYVFALVESAELNGVEFWRNFQVSESGKEGQYRVLTAADGRKIKARFTVNAAGLYADEVSKICGGEEFTICPRKGEEYLLDRTSPGRPSKVVFPVPTPCSKGMLVIPTAGGTTMIGPSATMVDDKQENSTTQCEREIIFEHSKKMVNGISERDLVAAFSGLRPVLTGNEDFFIARSEKADDLIQAAGIQSPGLTA
ncbi:MAG: NAD(P)/FAD-dependent oxidoreductase, partial [Lentisphaeria bacterium]|nr:NAD(P)/FAD-dependent oxidoreductase [Lentisphaeria bacterium]